ncbi:MAG TPA: Crp/Fnr family transcriptional regulator [Gammaproteobacteria bacterium]|jgi:CRP-like cAMP-binding protein
MNEAKRNWILAALPEAELARLHSQSNLVRLVPGQTLHQPGERAEYAYFPLDCLVTLVYITGDAATAEIAVTGREGMVGLELLLDEVAMPRWAVAQTAGSALRIRAEVLKDESSRSPALHDAFTRYLQAVIAQMMQLAVCNRHHDVGQQLCRLLLSRLDRQPGNSIEMSHEVLAGALGATPDIVTRVMLDLWSAGSIEQGVKHIEVLDRDALEQRACACHRTIRGHYDRLLPGWRVAGRRDEAKPAGAASAKLGEIAGHEQSGAKVMA